MKTPNVIFGLSPTRPNILTGILVTPLNFHIYKLLLVLLLTMAPANAQNFECPEADLILPPEYLNVEQEATAVLRIVGEFRGSVEWKVSSGKIVRGQGSQILTVVPDEDDAGKNIEVSATLLGLPSNCSVKVSDLLRIAPLPIGEPVDVLGKVGLSKDAKYSFLGRLDTYFAELSNSPSYEGLVEITFETKDPQKHRLGHLRTILNHIRFRRIDPSRFTFYLSEHDGLETTTFWTAAPGSRISKRMRAMKAVKGEELERELSTLFIDKK